MFFYTRGEFNRPAISLEIYRVGNKDKARVWDVFRKYHYLNTSLHPAAEQYIGIVNNELVCHTGIIQFPMRKGWKRVHRLVVLPDYQGIGIGMKFINAVSRMVGSRGLRVNLTTTTPSIVHALARSNEWNLVRQGRVTEDLTNFTKYYGDIGIGTGRCTSRKRVTYSFNHKEVNSIGTG